jgi:hypothetical protein
LVTIAAIAVFALLGCGDDSGGIGPVDGGGVPFEDGGAGNRDGGPRTDGGAGQDGGATEGRALTFDGTSPVTVYYGQFADLSFTLRTASGAAVQGAAVQFSLSGSGGFLSLSLASTNTSGKVSVRFNAGASDADLTLTASTERAPNATVALRVRVQPLGAVDVRVSAAIPPRIALARAGISLYAYAPGATGSSCAALASLATLPPTPFTFMVPAVPGAHLFDSISTGSTLIAFVRGYNATADLVARGCVEGAVVAGGQTTTINVVLGQLPSILAGDYDVLQSINLGAAIPAPYEDYVNTVTRALSDPAGVAVYYALRQVDASLGTHFMDWDPQNTGTQRLATLEEVYAHRSTFNTWNYLSAALDAELTRRLGQTYTDVKTIGGDIRTLVTAFEVGSHLQLATATQPNVYHVHESWRAIVFNWRYGCGTNDLGCARRAFQLANTHYAPVNVEYDANTSYAPLGGTSPETERYQVLPDAHHVPFSYGAVILIALSELVFPAIPGCGNCHSLADVFLNLVNCSALGTWISTTVNNYLGYQFIDPAQATSFCTSGLTALANRAEEDLLNLTVGGFDSVFVTKDQPGIGGGGIFYLVDANHDLKTERVQDLQMYVRWQDPANPAFTQDVTAPITGHGRESATHCATDLACGSSQSCQPIPSYLEVRALETTCARAVGATPGRQSCTQNNQCRSGICLGATQSAPGACFAACMLAAHCATGTCDPNRVALDLDGVRNGLGDAMAQGCNP